MDFNKAIENRIYYDAIARGYDELYGNEQRRKYQIGLKVLKPQRRVLDIGCGTGLLMEELEDVFYIGIDISLGMLERARERKTKLLADVIRADARSLPFRSNSFNTCYSFTVLQNLSSRETFYSEIRRTCRSTLVSSLKGIGLRCEQAIEVYPDLICVYDHSSNK